MLDLENLSKSFSLSRRRIAALDGVSLSVAKGEIFGVIGRSGAGKTTLIRCVNLLERPDGGTVRVDGRDLTALDRNALNEARRSIGMIFQHFNLLSSRTVFGNVALPLEIAGASAEEVRRRVPPLLETVGLADKAKQYPSQLSGGQKQRVGIARALATDPKVLLCDEATSALDPETTQSILALLARINRELGLTILLITHEMEVIKQICHRVAVMENGKIVEQGDVYDVFTRPQREVTQRFIASVTGADLPAPLAARISAQPAAGAAAVWRLQFTGTHADEPVITRAARRFGLDLAVLHGQIDTIRDRPFGTLVVSFHAPPDQAAALRGFFLEHGLSVTELGYVPGNLRAVG